MDDITPELLEAIRRDFLELLGDAGVRQPDYIGAAEYAEQVGSALAGAFRRNLSSAAMPDGKMYWNIAERVVRPMLEQDHKLVAGAAEQVQQALNEAAGLGIKAQSAPFDTDRANGILNKISAAEKYDDVAWVLDEPVKTFSRSIVDDTLHRNVEFQGKSGMTPQIIRRAESHCCEWCSKLDGIYRYPDVPEDIYRRHERCRCTVEYDPGSGKRQNVHSKKWTEPEEVLERRKNTPGIDTQSRVREVTAKNAAPENVMPEYLRTATPGRGSITYDGDYDRERHAAEIKTAQWLHDHLGGDIVLLNESHERWTATADYLWRGRLWDLKNLSSEKAANSAVRHGLKQIQENPGGIVLNLNPEKFSLSELQEVIDKRMQWNHINDPVDILVLAQGKFVDAKRYTKK